MTLLKQDIDKWLNEVSYQGLNSADYVPSEFALTFMNFIKLVNGGQGESHKTPPVHLKMLDKVVAGSPYIANLCSRGLAKTTLFFEYFSLYLGTFGYLPDMGEISGMIFVGDSMDNGVKNARKNIEYRWQNSTFLQEWLPEVSFTDAYIEMTNRDGHKFGVKMFGAKSGIRGSKIFAKRPQIAVLDDLVSDGDADSKASMEAIRDTVYSGVNYALDPNKRKVILNGTPFNKQDILVEAVESGGWDVNVWPVCEAFPCSEKEFSGAWPDRFNYDFVKSQYDFAAKNGKLASFYQELMLRITSDEERLVMDAEIQWYKRKLLLDNKHNFNFYITTDFATSRKQASDFTVILVWAYNSNGDWFLVDAIVERQTMDVTFNDLFRLVQEYKPQQVGVEVSGQQGAFISLLQAEMLIRNIWFNFASSSKSGEPGIRPTADKLSRFNLVVPWFKAGKMYLPAELRQGVTIGRILEAIRLATKTGLKGKDDCNDAISQLAYLTPWKPSEAEPMHKNTSDIWETEPTDQGSSALASYIV